MQTEREERERNKINVHQKSKTVKGIYEWSENINSLQFPITRFTACEINTNNWTKNGNFVMRILATINTHQMNIQIEQPISMIFFNGKKKCRISRWNDVEWSTICGQSFIIFVFNFSLHFLFSPVLYPSRFNVCFFLFAAFSTVTTCWLNAPYT